MTTTKPKIGPRSSLLRIVTVGLLAVVVIALWVGSATYLPDVRAYTGYYTPVFARLNDTLSMLSVALIFTLGALIVLRSSSRPYGWLMIVMILFVSLAAFSGTYSKYGLLVNPEAQLPLRIFTGWLQDIYMPAFMLLFSLVFLFPDGRLPSPRWRPIYWGNMAVWAVLAVLWAFTQRALGNNFVNAPRAISNPYGFIAPSRVLSSVINGLYVVGFLSGIGAGIASLIRRWRSEAGKVRQQIKWMLFSFMILLIVFAVTFFNDIVLIEGAGIDLGIQRALEVVIELAFFGIGVGLGLAVLQYRLYDIDLIIRRTLTYSLLTVFLVLVYGGSIVVLQQIFRTVTGQDSQLAIVISTLGIAALFAPLRQRIQKFINKRFNRSQYDPQKTLDSLSDNLRDEVDIHEVQDALIEAIGTTVQPAHISIWMKTPDNSNSKAH